MNKLVLQGCSSIPYRSFLRSPVLSSRRSHQSALPCLAKRTMHHTVHESITLNDTEKELLGTLLDAARHSGRGTVLRAAGGWVRGSGVQLGGTLAPLLPGALLPRRPCTRV